MPELNRYLTVTGFVTDDNQLDLQPGFLTDNGAGRSGGAIEQPLITVELLDGEGELIGRQPVAASSLCGYSDPSSSQLFLADKIPFPPGTRLIRFRWAYNDALLHELRVPGAPPQIRLRWTPPADGVEGEQVISWEARHPEDLPLQFIVLYTHNDGMSWRPLCLPQESSEFVVDFNALPGGIGHIKVLATDGVNTTEAASRRFAVQEKGYAAFILSPPTEPRSLQTKRHGCKDKAFIWRKNELSWNSSPGPRPSTVSSAPARSLKRISPKGATGSRSPWGTRKRASRSTSNRSFSAPNWLFPGSRRERREDGPLWWLAPVLSGCGAQPVWSAAGPGARRRRRGPAGPKERQAAPSARRSPRKASWQQAEVAPRWSQR